MANEKEALGLLEEIRKHPDRYLPMVDHAWKKFPRVDRGEEWYDDPQTNIGWDAGLLEGKRPYFLECWAMCGITMLTYFVSAEGLEDTGKEHVLGMLQDAGLFRITDPENPRTSIMEFTDEDGKTFLSVNITAGDEENTYVTGGRMYAFASLNKFNSGKKGEK